MLLVLFVRYAPRPDETGNPYLRVHKDRGGLGRRTRMATHGGDMTKQWTAGDILALAHSYWQAFALHTGVVLDVFTALENMAKECVPLTVAGLARATDCNERAMGMLVTGLVALGFLGRSGETLVLPEHSRVYLSRNSAEYLGFIIVHHAHLSPSWARLAEAVRTGGPVRSVSSSHTESESEREMFLMGMFNVAVNQAETVANALDFSGRKRLIDLGGGPGTYAVYFCKANPQLTATIFDKPTTEPIAMNIVRRYGLEQRIDFVGGNFLLDSLPEGYDVVWISQILHGDSPADCAKLVAKAGKILNPGGLLIIQDFVLDNDRTGPVHPAMFGLNMLVGTEGGQAYNWAEIETMMRDAGAVSVSRLDAALPMGCGILVGRMPG